MNDIRTTTLDTINELLRGEISAVETYTQAVEKFEGYEREILNDIKRDHIDVCNSLRQYVHSQQAVPERDSGAWGEWAQFVEGAAKTFGKVPALKALKEGEEHGIRDYEEALEKTELPEELRSFIRQEGISGCERHIDTLNSLMDQEKY